MKRLTTILMAMLLVFSLCACGQKAPTWQEQYDLGVKYLSEGNYEEAIIAFTAAIEIDSKLAMAYVGRGDANIGSGETEETLSAAQADYERAIELDETNAQAYLGLADVYIRLGEYDRALNLLNFGLEKTGGNQYIADKIAEMENGSYTDSSGNMRRMNAYDGNGNLIWYHIYDYDAQGGQSAATSYDGAGNQTSQVDIVYDKNGNVIYGTDGYFDDSGYFRPSKFIRSADGELLERITYQLDGAVEESVEYIWNSSRTEQETLHYDSTGALQESSITQYDKSGYPLEISWFNATGEKRHTGIYEYDESQCLLSITWFESDNTNFSTKWVYRYDDKGNQIGMDEYDSSGDLRRSTLYG